MLGTEPGSLQQGQHSLLAAEPTLLCTPTPSQIHGLFFNYYLNFLFYICVSPACISVHHIHGWCPKRPEEGAAPPETEVYSCELPCRYWELNLGRLEEQQAPLTTEPFLQFLLSKLLSIHRHTYVHINTVAEPIGVALMCMYLGTLDNLSGLL